MKLLTALDEAALKKLESEIPTDAAGVKYEPGTRPGELRALSPDESLRAGQRLVSMNGKFYAELHDGAGVVVRDKHGAPVWGLKVRPYLTSRLSMQKDLNLVLYSPSGRACWSSGTATVTGYSQCTLDDEGRLTLSNTGWTSDKAERIHPLTRETLTELEGLVPTDDAGVRYEPGTRPGERDMLFPGKPLLPGEHLVSLDGRYGLYLSETVGLELRERKTKKVVWSREVPAPGVARLDMQGDKNLVLYTKTGSVWAAQIPSAGVDTGKWCVLDDSGNYRVSDLWEACSHQGPHALASGRRMKRGEVIRSPNGAFTFGIRADGQLSVHDAKGTASWTNGLQFEDADHLHMQFDGNLVLRDSKGQELWSSDTAWEKAIGPEGTRRLEIFDNGEIGVFGNGASWRSGALAPNRLNPGQGLPRGAKLTDGENTLALSVEGVLTLTGRDGTELWRVGRPEQAIRGLTVRPRGKLELVAGDRSAVWSVEQRADHRNPARPMTLEKRGLWLGEALLASDPRLLPGEKLKKGERIRAIGKNYNWEMFFADDGQLVIETMDYFRWRRWSNGVKTTAEPWLEAKRDGTPVVRTSAGDIWSFPARSHANWLIELNPMGKLRVLVPDSGYTPFEPPQQTLIRGESLNLGQTLVSANGVHTFGLNNEGELFVTKDRVVVWRNPAPRTNAGVQSLDYLEDGHLRVTNRQGAESWRCKIAGGSHLALGDDGVVRVHDRDQPGSLLAAMPTRKVVIRGKHLLGVNERTHDAVNDGGGDPNRENTFWEYQIGDCVAWQTQGGYFLCVWPDERGGHRLRAERITVGEDELFNLGSYESLWNISSRKARLTMSYEYTHPAFYANSDPSYYRIEEQAPKVGWPGVWAAGVNVAVDNDEAVFFFRHASNEYIRFPKDASSSSGGPRDTRSMWPGVLEAMPQFNAATNWKGKYIFFFQGSQCLRFHLKDDKVDKGPSPISEMWPGVWADGVDAAAEAAGGTVYLFKFSKGTVIRWSVDKDCRVDEQPFEALFPGVWPTFDTIGATGGKLYFFKGREYLRFDPTQGRVDDGPHRIGDRT